MGIKGIYHEIGPGERIALTKLAVETFEQKQRPLRLAIDISIWLFQIQSGKGGTNPALRTFYYRLLRLISHSIHPLFVFDGPNKPPFKRGKRTGPNVASIPEFLAKQLLKQFAIPFHIAPGEAEAECALLQQEGIVDAVLSEDVDTLMFGSGLTLRNWSPEGTLKTKVFTHVNMYDAEKTKAGKSGLDRQGMILVALMSGGDYIPEGVPGCGPKTACEAARAGFGKDLCRLSRNDIEGITKWKERLMHELKTNESKFFRSKHKALVIPEDFPRRDVLRYYTHPCVSNAEKLSNLRQTLRWDLDIDITGLRTFVAEAFDWVCISGAKKFIRNLAPALLVKELRLRGENGDAGSDDTYVTAQEEDRLIKTIHLKRQHVTTDGLTEMRVGFIPMNLVNIDLDAEDPDPELPEDEDDSDEENGVPNIDEDNEEGTGEPKKKRAPLNYDPTTLEKIWILETFVKVGVPLKMQDWEESFRSPRKYLAMKSKTKRTEKNAKGKANGGMQAGALDRYTKVSKPGIDIPIEETASKEILPMSSKPQTMRQASVPIEETHQEASKARPVPRPVFRLPPTIPSPPSPPSHSEIVDLLSSPQSPQRKKRILRRSQSDTSALKKTKVAVELPMTETVPTKSTKKATDLVDMDPLPELPSSVTIRRHRSPFRRTNTISTSFAPPQPLSPPSHTHDSTIFPQSTEPPSSPGLPPDPDALKRPPRNQSSKPPSTPKKPHKHPSQTQQIITISSSPAPATPTSRQKSIIDYLSQRADPPSPSKNAPTLTQPPSLADIPNHSWIGKPPKPIFRPPLRDVQPTAVNTRSTHPRDEAVDKQRVVEMLPPRLQNGASQVIRLRESLAGAWRVEDLLSPEGEVEREGGGFVVEQAERKRKRNGERGREREWRVSQIEVLDLTEGLG